MQQMNTVTARVFDFNFNRVITKFFDVNLLKEKAVYTAASAFDSANDLIDQYDIQWGHCINKCLENTTANIRQQNSIKS